MNDDDPTPPPPPSFAGRVWSLRTVAAAAITAVALSGAGGAALAAASNGGSSGGPGGRGGFGGPPGRMGGPFPNQQNRQQGQVPGGTGLTSQVPGTPPRHRFGVPGQLPPATSREGQDSQDT